jgi:hypothetical protein
VLIISRLNMVLNLLEPLDAKEVARKNQRGKRRTMIAGGAACMKGHRIGGGRIRQRWKLRFIFSAMLD